MVAFFFVLAGDMRGADGMALSHDGLHWLAGAGAYGGDWADGGSGITVEAGGTLYIRLYSDTAPNRPLSYATHGAKWGSWSTTGPVLRAGVGDAPGNPVVLRVSNVGTSRSVVTWVNGTGTWSGLTSPGVYDFALHREAVWRLPPLVITEPRESRSGWRAWFGSWLPDETRPSSGPVSVADAGGTAVLLVVALFGLVLLWRIRRRRRARLAAHPDRTAG